MLSRSPGREENNEVESERGRETKNREKRRKVGNPENKDGKQKIKYRKQPPPHTNSRKELKGREVQELI